MLADRNQYYKDTGKSLYPQPAQYKEAYPYLKEVDSLALSNVQKQQNKAIKDHIENPKAFGVPKFKAKKTVQELLYDQQSERDRCTG